MLKRLKQKVLAFFIAYIGKYSLRFVLATCKLEIQGFDTFQKTLLSKKCILMLWHNRLSLVSELLFKLDPHTIYAAFISKSRDGDPLALLATSYKTGKAIRVPHDRKHQALKIAINTLKNSNEVVIITPDGPRGPRYQVKPGIVIAAKETDAMIVPLTWTATKFWQLKSWDKLIFPKPFSKIFVTFGDAKDVSLGTAEENQLMLQENLLQLEDRINTKVYKTKEYFPK